MVYDYCAALGCDHPNLPEDGRVWNLASGFVDRAAVDSAIRKAEDARRNYQDDTSRLSPALPDDLSLDPEWTPTISGWFSLSVAFELRTPWYSEDDRPFHVLDNPVRKDRVFGVPFMSAASWKGLLRWACRMEAGLLGHLEMNGNELRGWRDPEWIEHLFGNEKGEQEDFLRGALAFRPTWFSKVGFELINPHDRERRAGTVPIIYEVVPPGAEGTLRLLYAPPPGSDAPNDTFEKLFAAVEKLLTVYGFSAKRTAGWGGATISTWKVAGVGGVKADLGSCAYALRAVAQVRTNVGGQP